ncbi:imidazole glycerol phosphate synthase subunit HisH [Ramlibacter sp. 2FC]|uniref:imidazole glycerol phosphate synthase subunit HisH n=1 Tax=Ramlibacter sp. 2FC TaxID=2502188 RepID=UPI0010FA4090|nr:imidazole glycerol phosphate synthase subunit HisH [Ramlibacter sp. 2FC]
MRVGVIDYGVGNLGSVLRALEELRVAPVLVNRALDLHAVDCLILPGVGNFADCARLLEAGGWPTALRDEVLGYGRPLLGVCVGMQLLADASMEGSDDGQGTPGLGFVPGRVEHLRTLGCTLRVPHVGWNGVTRASETGGLFDGIPDGTDFYFVHSYAFVPQDPSDVLATADYGVSVTAAVRRGRVWGTQFHPEKSSRAGFRLLRNFISGPSC